MVTGPIRVIEIKALVSTLPSYRSFPLATPKLTCDPICLLSLCFCVFRVLRWEIRPRRRASDPILLEDVQRSIACLAIHRFAAVFAGPTVARLDPNVERRAERFGRCLDRA